MHKLPRNIKDVDIEALQKEKSQFDNNTEWITWRVMESMKSNNVEPIARVALLKEYARLEARLLHSIGLD